MDIVIGRGNRRQVISLPCGQVMAAAQKQDPADYKKGLEVLLCILGVR